MERVNGQPAFYLGWVIGVLNDRVLTLPIPTFNSLSQVALLTANQLEYLNTDAVRIDLPLTKAAALEFAGALRMSFSEELLKTRGEEEIPPSDRAYITATVTRLSTLIAAELADSDLYYVSAVRAWKMKDLIASAEKVFSESVVKTLSGTCKKEIREAGRCIAFDLPTACGFHIFRAIEIVVLDYFPLLGIKDPEKNGRNLGAYITILEGSGKLEDKTTGMLRHLKDIYRNPLMHPEMTMTSEEAGNLFGFGTSFISAMVAEQIRLKSSPPTASAGAS